MIGAIKFLSAAMIVVAVSAVVLAVDQLSKTELETVKSFEALDLENYDADKLKNFLEDCQPKGLINGILTRSKVITVEQTGQLLHVYKLWKQLTQGSTLDCSFESMDKFGKIEIDKVKNKVMRHLLEEKFKFVLHKYLLECVPVMHKKAEELILEQNPNFSNQTQVGIVHFFHSISEEPADYLDPWEFDVDFVKNKATNPRRKFYWRKMIDSYGRRAFQTDICLPIEENEILRDIIDVVAGAVENKWSRLSRTSGTIHLKLDSTSRYPVCLYLLGLMCKHERNESSDQRPELEVAKNFQELDLQDYDAKGLKDLLDNSQSKGGLLTRPKVITVEQTGQLLLADKLQKQLTQGSSLDCSFKTMDKFGKIEIDKIENKVMRYLLEEKFEFVLSGYLPKCAPLMHKEVEYFIEHNYQHTIKIILSSIIEDAGNNYLDPQSFDLNFVKDGVNPHLRAHWRTKIDDYESGGGVFQTDVCLPVEENEKLKNIIDVVAGAMENKWTHLSKTKESFLKVDVNNYYPVSLYLLGLMCQYERSEPSQRLSINYKVT